MTSLLDIAPERVSVVVHGHSLEVEGLTVGDLAALMRRFPELRQLFGGASDAALDGLAATVPGLAAAVIASGLGHAGDEAHETQAAKLPAWAASELFGAIVRLTMPAGIGPFVEGLVTAFGPSPAAAALPNGSLAP